MATLLSAHFSLEELTTTQVRGVDNTPSDEVVAHLSEVAAALEKVRTLLGDFPVIINSGYRSPEVNERVGGTANSAHISGYAADFICPLYGTPLEICRKLSESDLKWDQLIEEGTWVHLSVATTMRQQILTKAEGGGYAYGLPKVAA